MEQTEQTELGEAIVEVRDSLIALEKEMRAFTNELPTDLETINYWQCEMRRLISWLK